MSELHERIRKALAGTTNEGPPVSADCSTPSATRIAIDQVKAALL